MHPITHRLVCQNTNYTCSLTPEQHEYPLQPSLVFLYTRFIPPPFQNVNSNISLLRFDYGGTQGTTGVLMWMIVVSFPFVQGPAGLKGGEGPQGPPGPIVSI